jgi:hypothetical protein
MRGLARSIRLRSVGEWRAFQRSVRRWMLSQKSAELPKTRARMRADWVGFSRELGIKV